LHDRRLVPVEPQPLEALLDQGLAALLEAYPVGILDPEQELAAVLPGEQVVEEGGAGASEMERPGWAGRVAVANVWHRSIVMAPEIGRRSVT